MSGKRTVRSVLVLTKFRYMGDTVVAAPLLGAARRAFPDARLSLLTGPAAATVLEGCPYLDDLIPFAPYDRQRGTPAFLRLIHFLRKTIRPDLCLVANRSYQSALAALLCGAHLRAGFASEGRGWLLTHPIPYDADRHEIDCYLDILRAVAPDSPDRPYDSTPRLWITDAERARGAKLLAEREALGPVLVGLQPGASYSRKQWPTERFAAVADALAAGGAGIVLIGGPEEVEVARTMRRAMHAPAVDLTGVTGLRETMGVLSHLTLFVGNDTGVNHIAAALGVATVGLFGPTPAHKWGNTGPRGAILAGPEEDITRIDVNAVITAARGLLTAASNVGVRR